MDSKQIAAALMKDIVSGVYAAEGCLPGENALARTYGVARMTMRGILEDFRRQGLITRRKGARSVLTQHGSRKSGILGLVVPDYDKFEFFATLRNHLDSLCSRIGYRLELVSTDCVSPNAAAIVMRKKVRQLAIKRAEGVIFRPFVSPDLAKSNAELARILHNAEIPVVLIDSDIVHPPERSDFDLVAVDNVDAGRLLAAHLLETGRRRIAFMTSGHPATANDNWRNRLFGLAGELSVLGANEGVRTLPFPSAGPNAVRKLMKGRAAPPGDRLRQRRDGGAADTPTEGGGLFRAGRRCGRGLRRCGLRPEFNPAAHHNSSADGDHRTLGVTSPSGTHPPAKRRGPHGLSRHAARQKALDLISLRRSARRCPS